MVAAVAEAVIGPNPGMLISRRAVSSFCAIFAIVRSSRTIRTLGAIVFEGVLSALPPVFGMFAGLAAVERSAKMPSSRSEVNRTTNLILPIVVLVATGWLPHTTRAQRTSQLALDAAQRRARGGCNQRRNDVSDTMGKVRLALRPRCEVQGTAHERVASGTART